MDKIQCNICGKSYFAKGMKTHIMRIHGTDEEKARFVYGKIKDPENTKGMIKHRQNVADYNDNPKLCKECQCGIPYDKRYNVFCSSSCAGRYNNLNSPPTRKFGPAKKVKIKEPKLPYSTLYKCICKHCGLEWRNRFNVQFCDAHKEMYSHAGRAAFWFTFSISAYPDLFDGGLLKKHGMRSRDNPNGVTRDHRVSVQEAIINGYEPYYIKHPVNCELMLFKDNASKHTKSSMTYEELVSAVDKYELNKMVGSVGLEPTTNGFRFA